MKAITDPLVTDAETLENHGVSLVAINSNDAVSYPEEFVREHGNGSHSSEDSTFPYLHDRLRGFRCALKTSDMLGGLNALIERSRLGLEGVEALALIGRPPPCHSAPLRRPAS